MAFKSKPVALGTSDTLIYECPAGTEGAIVLLLSNNANAARTFTVKHFDSVLGQTFALGTAVALAANTPVKFPTPIAMEPGDQLFASSPDTGVVAFATVTQGTQGPQFRGLVPAGPWVIGTTYESGDVVAHMGSTFLSRADDNMGNEPDPDDQSDWMVLSLKGETGPAGSNGADGDGDLTGPSGAIDGRFPAFDGITGKALKDSSYSAASFATAAQGVLAANALPTAGGTLTGALTLSADPASPLQPATKQYVDGLLANMGKRQRVRAATTVNVTISTALNSGDTLDGVTLATGDLVLVKNQTAPAENGVYVVAASPGRAPEFDTFNEYSGSLIAVAEGSANADTLWLSTSNDGGILGTTAITFSKMVIAGELLAGNNLSDLASVATALTNLGLSANGAALVAMTYSAMRTALGLGAAAVLGEATPANIRAGTADVVVTPDQAEAALLGVAATWTGAVTLDFDTFETLIVSATGNVTLGAVSNIVKGKVYIVEFTHTTAAQTIALNSTYWKTAKGAGLTLSTTAGAKDKLIIFGEDDGKASIGVAGLAVA